MTLKKYIESQEAMKNQFSPIPQPAGNLLEYAPEQINALLAQRDALQATIDTLANVLQAIDELTCNCPCMSLQAQHEFERCKEAEAYKMELAKVVIEIRAQARVAIALAQKGPL